MTLTSQAKLQANLRKTNLCTKDTKISISVGKDEFQYIIQHKKQLSKRFLNHKISCNNKVNLTVLVQIHFLISRRNSFPSLILIPYMESPIYKVHGSTHQTNHKLWLNGQNKAKFPPLHPRRHVKLTPSSNAMDGCKVTAVYVRTLTHLTQEMLNIQTDSYPVPVRTDISLYAHILMHISLAYWCLS